MYFTSVGVIPYKEGIPGEGIVDRCLGELSVETKFDMGVAGLDDFGKEVNADDVGKEAEAVLEVTRSFFSMHVPEVQGTDGDEYQPSAIRTDLVCFSFQFVAGDSGGVIEIGGRTVESFAPVFVVEPGLKFRFLGKGKNS